MSTDFLNYTVNELIDVAKRYHDLMSALNDIKLGPDFGDVPQEGEKRGRPKKVAPVQDTSPPKRRGRPPKQRSEEAIVASPPKRRGRPPKQRSEEADSRLMTSAAPVSRSQQVLEKIRGNGDTFGAEDIFDLTERCMANNVDWDVFKNAARGITGVENMTDIPKSRLKEVRDCIGELAGKQSIEPPF